MSPLCFSIPPRTALAGILGAILGIDKAENPEHFDNDKSFIAYEVLNPVKKLRIAHNYLKTNQGMKDLFNIQSRKPTNVEYLKNVRYRLFVALEDVVLHDRLKKMLSENYSTYTIALGISGCLAHYRYLGEYPVEKKTATADTIQIDSVIPLKAIKKLALREALKLQKAVIPANMKNNREVSRYEEVLFEMNGKKIPLVPAEPYYELLLNNEIHRIYGI